MTSLIVSNPRGLTDDEIKATCPSVFAEEAAGICSANYLFIPTYTIIAGMRAEGFVPTYVSAARTRVEGMAPYTKHSLRFRAIDDLQPLVLGQEFFELWLVNAHNRGSAYKLMQGFFRLVCLNGMVRGSSTDALSVPHKGDILDQILSATYKIVEAAPAMMEAIEAMKHIDLSEEERVLFAKFAMLARWPKLARLAAAGQVDATDEEPGIVEGTISVSEQSLDSIPDTLPSIYQPEQFLVPRRREDSGHSLYMTLNVVQENIMKRGVQARVRTKDGGRKRQTVKAISGIDETIKVNTLLLQFAEELKKIHSA